MMGEKGLDVSCKVYESNECKHLTTLRYKKTLCWCSYFQFFRLFSSASNPTGHIYDFFTPSNYYSTYYKLSDHLFCLGLESHCHGAARAGCSTREGKAAVDSASVGRAAASLVRVQSHST